MNIHFKRIADNELFQSFIFFVILVTALSMGLETVPEIYEANESFFEIVFYLTQAIFVAEICIRIFAYLPSISQFFRNFWNVFDFIIVLLSLIPFVGSFALVARLSRVLRVVRLLSNSERLRSFSERLGDTWDEICYAIIIIGVGAYVYSISGHYMFFEVDPNHWGDLTRSLLSVFYLALLQDVPSYVEPIVAHSKLSFLFFIIFYITFFGFILSVINAAISQRKTK